MTDPNEVVAQSVETLKRNIRSLLGLAQAYLPYKVLLLAMHAAHNGHDCPYALAHFGNREQFKQPTIDDVLASFIDKKPRRFIINDLRNDYDFHAAVTSFTRIEDTHRYLIVAKGLVVRAAPIGIDVELAGYFDNDSSRGFFLLPDLVRTQTGAFDN